MHAPTFSSYASYQQQQYGGYAAVSHQDSAYGAFPEQSSCVVCTVQSVEQYGAVCSRRCEWVYHGCCPQCGRMRGMAGYFCSPMCASEARQANWCVACGVRQLAHGSPTCGSPGCVALCDRVARAAVFPHATRFRNAVADGTAVAKPQHNGGRGSRSRFEPHVNLSLNDKVVAALKQQLGVDAGRRLTAVVKIGGAAEDRKRYTAYRCRVESEMNETNGIGAPKFGHGGEGNEHRRFIPLRSECGVACVGHDGNLRSCGAPSCEVCTLLEGGIQATCHSAAIPAFSSVVKAADGASSAEGAGVIAVAVCRVTVGNANVVSAMDIDPKSGAVPGPGPKDHSTVVTHDGHDVAYVASREPTVDPLFVLFLRC